MKDYPGLWNMSGDGVIQNLNETVVYKLHHVEGAWYNLSKKHKFLKLYHAIANETEKKHKMARQELEKMTRILISTVEVFMKKYILILYLTKFAKNITTSTLQVVEYSWRC